MRLLSYKWSAILLVVSVTLLGYGLTGMIAFFQDSGTHFQGPGEAVITVETAAEYILFTETTAMVDGRIQTFPLQLPEGMQIEVAQLPDEINIPMRPYHNMSMESPGVRRVSLAAIQFPTPGRYRFRVTGADQPRGFYLSPNTFLSVVFRFMLCGCVGMLALFAAMGLGIRQFILNSKLSQRSGDAETDTEGT